MALEGIEFDGEGNVDFNGFRGAVDVWCGDQTPEELAESFVSCDGPGKVIISCYANEQPGDYVKRFQGEVNRLSHPHRMGE